jgi:hypothetical protein
MDSAYTSKYLAIARMLWDASEGNPARIPEHYADHLRHDYIDGSVSLASLLNRFEHYEFVEDYEFEEAVEMLGKVNPNDWPNVEDITSVSLEDLLESYEAKEDDFDFAEDNYGTAEKIEKGLAKVIESVLGEEVDNIRGKGGNYPSPDNNFLQQPDGTFAGTFNHADHKFNFEIYPDENGWTVTYRLSAESVDSLAPMHDEDKTEDDPTKKDYTRSPRNRGWK